MYIYLYQYPVQYYTRYHILKIPSNSKLMKNSFGTLPQSHSSLRLLTDHGHAHGEIVEVHADMCQI